LFDFFTPTHNEVQTHAHMALTTNTRIDKRTQHRYVAPINNTGIVGVCVA